MPGDTIAFRVDHAERTELVARAAREKLNLSDYIRIRLGLGDAEGTVAVRLPDDAIARELLRRTGPLAVSSANRSGRPAATDAAGAVEQLGERAAVVLDGGVRAGSAASTIVDCTAPTPRVLRVGAVDVDRLRAVVPELTD